MHPALRTQTWTHISLLAMSGDPAARRLWRQTPVTAWQGGEVDLLTAIAPDLTRTLADVCAAYRTANPGPGGAADHLELFAAQLGHPNATLRTKTCAYIAMLAGAGHEGAVNLADRLPITHWGGTEIEALLRVRQDLSATLAELRAAYDQEENALKWRTSVRHWNLIADGWLALHHGADPEELGACVTAQPTDKQLCNREWQAYSHDPEWRHLVAAKVKQGAFVAAPRFYCQATNHQLFLAGQVELMTVTFPYPDAEPVLNRTWEAYVAPVAPTSAGAGTNKTLHDLLADPARVMP